MANLIKKKKYNYYKSSIESCGHDAKRLYNKLNFLMGKGKGDSCPDGEWDNLVDDFSQFFDSKISVLKSRMGTWVKPKTDMSEVNPIWCSFPEISKKEFSKVFSKLNKTHSEADPFPIRDMLEAPNFMEISEILRHIVNLSLNEGVFPSSEKEAFISPLLKAGLDKNLLSSYRPVSKVSFLSKIIEACVQGSLIAFLENENVYPKHQSAYRMLHSTETTLLKIHNDLMKNFNSRNCSILIMLDNSAAFDTICHEALLHKFSKHGVGGSVLRWFKSFLTDRSCRVKMGDSISEPRPLNCGVPQGGINSPYLFTFYTADLAKKLEGFGVEFHFYADDLQLYMKIDNINENIITVQHVLSVIYDWMWENPLKLNEDKKKVLLIGSQRIREVCFDNFPKIIFHESEPMSDGKKSGCHI